MGVRSCLPWNRACVNALFINLSNDAVFLGTTGLVGSFTTISFTSLSRYPSNSLIREATFTLKSTSIAPIPASLIKDRNKCSMVTYSCFLFSASLTDCSNMCSRSSLDSIMFSLLSFLPCPISSLRHVC